MIAVAGELAAEQEERHVGADHRGRLEEAVGRLEPRAGEQVVGQRVAGEALDRAEQQQDAADHPVQLTGLAERAGERHPHQVDHHRGDEDHRRPVVHLPHQETAADVEGDVQRRGVGVGHRDAAQLGVGALVRRLRHARHEPQGQEHAGHQQHDERPQRDLTEHERPVVGEHLAQVLPHDRGQAEPVVEPAGDRSRPARRRGTRGLVPVAGCHSAQVRAHAVPYLNK